MNIKKTHGAILMAALAAACSAEMEGFSEEDELASVSQKVINGTEVTPNSVPYMGIISGLSQSPGGHRCGASLIDPQYALTAAHCVIERGYVAPPSTIKVAFGAHDISTLTTDPNVQLIDSEYIMVHPGFDATTAAHDLALVRLAHPATLNSRVQTIPLAYSGDAPGTQVKVTGWGKTSSTSGKSYVLREGRFPLVPNSTCEGVLSKALDNTMLCAGYVPEDPEDRITACHGDSGGPLVADRGGGYLEQVGVVSWGQAEVCGTYSVYSKVTSQRSFIEWVLASGYRYLRCNNTGWNVGEANRLQPVSINSFQLDYDVTQLTDTCVLTHTNQLNGWGTKNGDYKISWTLPPTSVPAEGDIGWEGSAPTVFQIRYPAPGRYRIVFPVPLNVQQQTRFQVLKLD